MFQGTFDLWVMPVPVTEFPYTGYILTKAKYTNTEICMENIISWDKLKNVSSIANGPGRKALTVNMPWSSALLVMIEIILAGIGHSGYDYYDRFVKYDNKRKSTDNLKTTKKKMAIEWADSDDDFEPETKEKNKGIKPKNTNSVNRKTINQKKCVYDNPKPGSSSTMTPVDTPSTGTSMDNEATPLLDSESESEEVVEPPTPPTNYNAPVARSKSLEQSEIESQNLTPKRNKTAKASPRPTSFCLFYWFTPSHNRPGPTSRWRTRCASPQTRRTMRNQVRQY